MAYDYKEHIRKCKQELLEASMESVRLLGELYKKGEFTPENQRMVYERERIKTLYLREDIEECEKALKLGL